MSCIFKIKEAFASYTSTEKIIADYILNHRNETVEKSAQELGEITKTSAAAWIRFSKKLGFKGLTALKVDLAKNLDEEDELFNVVIEEQDSLSIMVKKIQTMSYQHMEGTYKLLNLALLQQAITWLINARRIYLCGIGGSGIVCMDLMQKLTRIDKESIYYEDSQVLAARLAHANDNDVLIAISYSGETNTVNRMVKLAQSKNCKVVAITQYNMRSTLSCLADISLYVPVVEKTLRLGSISSRNSALTLTDLLYYGVGKHQLGETKDDLIKTRDFIEQINKE